MNSSRNFCRGNGLDGIYLPESLATKKELQFMIKCAFAGKYLTLAEARSRIGLINARNKKLLLAVHVFIACSFLCLFAVPATSEYVKCKSSDSSSGCSIRSSGS